MYTTPIKNFVFFVRPFNKFVLNLQDGSVSTDTNLCYSFDFTANLGGTLGLCIGASLLTFVEFFQFGFGLCVGAWSRRKQRETAADTNVKAIYPADS